MTSPEKTLSNAIRQDQDDQALMCIVTVPPDIDKTHLLIIEYLGLGHTIAGTAALANVSTPTVDRVRAKYKQEIDTLRLNRDAYLSALAKQGIHEGLRWITESINRFARLHAQPKARDIANMGNTIERLSRIVATLREPDTPRKQALEAPILDAKRSLQALNNLRRQEKQQNKGETG